MKQIRLKGWLTVLASMMSIAAWAYDAKVNNIYYTFSGEEATVVDMEYNYKYPNWNATAYSGDVVIPETVTYEDKTYRVTAIGAHAFYYCGGVTSVSIPACVKSIGEGAFMSCKNLTSVNIPSGITEISANTFRECNSLSTVDLPDGVTSIGESAFYGCSKMEKIPVPSSLRYMGAHVFLYTAWYNALPDGIYYVGKVLCGYKGNMPAGTVVDVEEGTVCIAGSSFLYNSNLTSITMPNSVEEIGPYAFDRCSNLESVVLSEKLRSIQDAVFRDCSSLSSINIPASLTSIGTYAFQGCVKLPSFTIGSSLKSIGNYAFQNCTSLTYMDVPDNVETLGKGAFMGCTGLERFVIGKGVKELTTQLFGSTHIKSLTVGPNVSNAAKDVFWGDASGSVKTYPVKILLLSNDLPAGKQYLYGAATICLNPKSGWTTLISKDFYVTGFQYELLNSKFEVDGVIYVPTSLTDRTCDVIDCRYDESNETVTIGSTVTYKGVTFTVKNIQRYAFQENKHLKKLSLANVGLIYPKAFYGCENIEELQMNTKGDMNERVFENCKNLKTVEMGSEVTGIGDYAFHACEALNGIDIPNSVTSLGKYAFYECPQLAYARIGSGVKEIGMGAFWGCTSMEELLIGSNVTTIGRSAFSGCSALNSLRIPKSVTKVEKAFGGCTALQEVIIENGNEAISMAQGDFSTCQLDTAYIGRSFGSSSPFQKCESLRAVELAPGITELGYQAFYNCKGLKNVHLGSSLTNIGNRAFFGCGGLERIELGPKVEKIGQEAFSGCSAMTTLVCYAVKPPVCQYLALTDIDKWACTLYVPQGALPAYGEAEQWKDFLFKEETEIMAKVEGDVNGDGTVDEADIDTVVDCIMNNPSGNCQGADANGDTKVDVADIVYILNMINKNTQTQVR